MIEENDLSVVASEARAHANYFLHQYEKRIGASEFLDNPKRAFSTLASFVEDCLGSTIAKTKLGRSGYGSWLVRVDENRCAIAIDENQMVSWQQVKGLPLAVQKIRAVVHELGHTQLSPGIMNVDAGREAEPATPYQEEIAWVYTFCFLGMIVGDYSFHTRTNQDIDDAPKYLV